MCIRDSFICALQVVAVLNCSSIPSDNCGCIVSTSSDTSSIVAILNTRSAIYITSYPSHIYGSCSAAGNGTCVIAILYCTSPQFSNDTAYMSFGCGDFCTVDTATNGCAIGLGCNAGNAFRARHCTIHFHILHHGAARQRLEQTDIVRFGGNIQRHGVAVAVKGADKVVGMRLSDNAVSYTHLDVYKRQDLDGLLVELGKVLVAFLALLGAVDAELFPILGVLGVGQDAVQRNCRIDRKSTRLNSSHLKLSRMPSSA